MAYYQNGQLIGIRRKVFISHFKGDSTEVEEFIQKFANEEHVFIPKVLGANENYDYIDSANTDYVMTQIREKYLLDSTVTIVLVGSCTHSRRYIDWELKSSLRQGDYTPNGVMGIILPSKGNSAYLPPRLKSNWEEGHGNCYARYWIYPTSAKELHNWIEDAFLARTTRTHLIKNSQEILKYNRKCNICNITH
ncbi:TIR domain-containing protein [Aliarcobacter butzleri]|uniref:TIR domain-containing protein n=1 Tax=Aliarcobacter butzleri TaxID=28197 RepID=UPI0012612A9C|nr:TIR domain-containing protein [Aliarcobacter butzleri]MCT7614878.1 TIR domain-containing protein [Aliarcobacter butzleri]